MSIRSELFANSSAAIGNTPLFELSKISPEGGGTVYGKGEFCNPGGSVKDRICLSIIEDAEKQGLLGPGGTVVESTSGNTGIGLALICAVRGYQCILTMPETMSEERARLLRGYGAEVVLTSRLGGMAEAILTAEQIAREKGPTAFMPMQFENPANPEAHRRGTAPEILSLLSADEISAFVAGVGTGGTLTGVGEVLKAARPEIQIVAVEPSASPILSGGKPGPHGIQGIGAGFIPPVLNMAVMDEVIQVSEEEAFGMRHRLGREEGLMVGISAGANVAAAVQLAARLGPGSKIVTILCDTGERYLSLDLDKQ